MNHLFLIPSVAVLGLFYGVLFLSVVRDFFRSQDAGDSDGDKPVPPKEPRTPNIKSVFLAHWVMGGEIPSGSAPFSLKQFGGLPGSSSLSVN